MMEMWFLIKLLIIPSIRDYNLFITTQKSIMQWPTLYRLNPQDFYLKTFLILFAKKPALEKFLIFSQKNGFLHISENGTFPEKCFSYISGNFLALRLKDFRKGHSELKKRPILKKFLLFWEMKPSSPRIENFLIFQEGTLKFQA